MVWRSAPLWHVFLMVLLCYLLFQLVTFVFQPCIFAITFIAFFSDEVLQLFKKFAAPSPSSSIAVSSVVLPMIISLESFFTLSRRLFSSTCLSYAAVGDTRMHSRHFVYSWMPEFSGHWSDAVWYWRAFVRSSTVAYSESIVLTVGFGTSSRVW